jgi:lipoprotein NlpI
VKWPAPVVALYLGKKTPAQAMAAAKTAGQRCEVLFYGAELQLARHRTAAALGPLKLAAKTCPLNYIEHAGALAELRHARP